jgi:hypothetical protein
MVKGRQKNDPLMLDDIYSLTNGGYDIYMNYLGKVQRIMSRPWGKKESKDSWGIYYDSNQGIWFWKDHATEESGTAIQFVQRSFGLTFAEARAKILWDFGFDGGKNLGAVKVTWAPPTEEEKEDYIQIQFDTKPFQKQHHAFWNIAEVSEVDCNRKECWALNSLAINKKRIHVKDDEAAFAYYCPEEDAVKIYFADREKGKKFRNNVSYHYLWNYSHVEDCEDLIVQKSNKDMIVTSMITPCVIATQAEAVKIFNPTVVGKINKISKTPWIWYGSDDDGVKKCKEVTGCHKWRYINTPKKMLPDVNDTYSFVRYHNLLVPGSGLKQMEEFMKLKKLIK